MLGWLCLASGASAQEQPACTLDDGRPCGCEQGWGCWDLFYSGRDSVLGVKATTTVLPRFDSRAPELAVLATLGFEHYGTRRGLTAHVMGNAAIGGGTASTEGSFFGAADIGVRSEMRDVDGVFVRGGATAMLLGNAELFVSALQPLQARIGYQRLDGDTLIEAGLTSGFVLTGSYDFSAGRTGSLSRSFTVGSYVAAHVWDFRADLSFERIATNLTRDGQPLDVLRLRGCTFVETVAFCGELLALRAGFERSAIPGASATYVGLTVGLTP